MADTCRGVSRAGGENFSMGGRGAIVWDCGKPE
jgi:hypothetical protein